MALTLYFPTVLSLQMTAYTMYGAAITPAILFALFSKKVTPAAGMAGILVGGLATIIWTLMGTPYGIQCAIVAVPASVIAILVVSAVTRRKSPGPWMPSIRTTDPTRGGRRSFCPAFSYCGLHNRLKGSAVPPWRTQNSQVCSISDPERGGRCKRGRRSLLSSTAARLD